MQVHICDKCKKERAEIAKQFFPQGTTASAAGCGSEEDGVTMDLCGACCAKFIKAMVDRSSALKWDTKCEIGVWAEKWLKYQ